MLKLRSVRHVSWLAVASVMVACSDNPVYIDGFAATGAAMANADVTAKCVEGPSVSGKTDANGLFQLRIDGGQVAPCIVQVTDGTTTLHSFATAAGRLNVTPLTELSVGKAFGEAPSAAFSAFDKAKSTKIKDGLTSATAAVKTEVEALTGKPITGDMLTSTFKVGDPDDLVLDTLKVKLQDLGKPLADVTAALVASKPLSAIAPRVRVFGDSLSDSGTFLGLKFTVQGTAATGPGSSNIWVDVVAAQFQKSPLCAYFRSSTDGPPYDTKSGCTNYAIGGGRINFATNPADFRSIVLQLQTAAQVHGSYTASDILLIDGGGNDAADLAGGWLGATAQPQNFQNLLVSALGDSATGTLLGSDPTGVAAGTAYMQKLADNLADAVITHAVEKGAKKVLVMNLPDIALTPRFTVVLGQVKAAAKAAAQAAAGGTLSEEAADAAGAAKADEVKTVIQSWVNAFNTKLASRFAATPAAASVVAVLDFNKTFRDQVANPGAFGFTNSKDTVCRNDIENPFPTCTATALSAMTGKPSADWWQTYLFSDGFHPTPLAHQKAGEQALAVMTQRGWN